MSTIEELIQQCDDSIKTGRAASAARLLAALPLSRIHRKHRLPLAQLCRRAGQISYGLKLLSKLVLDETAEGKDLPSSSELAEYAVLLQRSGALSEAFQYLIRVDANEAPEALLYRSFIHFARWEFSAAIPILKDYIRREIPPYAAAVGQVNLAFALIEGQQIDEAFSVLNNLNSATNVQLQSNAHALKGQAYLQQNAYSKARAEFEQAHKIIEDGRNNDRFFAIKWRLILEGLEKRNPDAFARLQILAAKNRAWEVSREADLFSLKVNYVRERFVRLYFGTPFAAFRERMTDELGPSPTQPIYVYGDKATPRLDLRTGEIDGKPVLNPTNKCHLLLDALLRDLYRPVRVAGLFSIIFPDEHFNISSSPHRIHQLITRTRAVLRSHDIPVEIKEDSGFYSLNLNGRFSFRIPLERGLHRPNPQLVKLQSLYGSGSVFTAKQVHQGLKLSPATSHRLIHQALAEGIIEPAGQTGRALLYRFKTVLPSEKAA